MHTQSSPCAATPSTGNLDDAVEVEIKSNGCTLYDQTPALQHHYCLYLRGPYKGRTCFQMSCNKPRRIFLKRIDALKIALKGHPDLA